MAHDFRPGAAGTCAPLAGLAPAAFREAVALLDHCHKSSRHASEPVCGAILGTSGVGKTSVVDHYRKSYPAEETETATRQPVLKVTLQPDARPKGIASDLLMALGDPAWSRGTVQTLTNRAVKLLHHCGVELIVMDEFHHLFDIDRARVMTKASQWLKVLIVNTKIPIVVCGMPEAEHVLSEHTERRFKERLTLRCFTWRTTAGRRASSAACSRSWMRRYRWLRNPGLLRQNWLAVSFWQREVCQIT